MYINQKQKLNGEVEIRYDYNGISFTVKDFSDWGAGTSIKARDKINFLSSDADGYINIRVLYEKTYTDSNSVAGISAFANINKENDLTIATNTGSITGLVRLKFTNTDSSGNSKTYYSEDIFNIENENSTIYCQIKNDYYCWYNNDWKVEVLDIAGNTIKSTDKMEYYTINDALGLKCFANATNGGAKTETRIFYLIRDVNLENETVNPICQSTANWFDGYFGSGIYHEEGGYVDKGGQHSISNIKIKVENNSNYAYGLFGWVGAKATIENLIIDSIEVSYTPDYNNVKTDIKVGGLAGYADNGGAISNIKITESIIKGYAYYVGGLIGNCEKIIENCSIEKSTIGLGDSKASKKSDSLIYGTNDKANQYYVGGLVGKLKNALLGECSAKECTVTGGKVQYKNLSNNPKDDEKAFVCTGGLIGSLEYNIEINNTFDISKTTVYGFDNVGGVIGYNHSGTISGITFNGSVKGSGENIGGIVGYNYGGAIKGCTNCGSVEGTGKTIKGKETKENETKGKVGGIVGLNYNQEIKNCKNEKNINGKSDVGGIVGLCYGGTIELCENSGNITGEENCQYIGYYFTASEFCTGTGGIAGKIHGALVTKSCNIGTILSNFNGGGIVGLNQGGAIEYSFNSGAVNSNDTGTNRIGGICGAGNSMTIIGCYNVGSVKGFFDANVLSNGIGGICGTCVDNKYNLTNKEYTLDPNNKYLGKVTINVYKIYSSTNVFKYCYNAGNLSGNNAGVRKTCGILGCLLVAPSDNGSATFTDNFYVDKVEYGVLTSLSEIHTGISGIDNGNYKKSAEELKKQLYSWASIPSGSGGLMLTGTENTYIYNTTAPVETGLGFEGYGILWWQLEGYGRTTFHVYDNVGVPIYKDITLHIGDSTVNLENYSKLNCSRGIETYGYILMLNKSNEYKSKATNSKYIDDANQEIKVNIGHENDVYIGKRPEFILAINNNNTNNNNITRTENIPAGDYYIIACGGRRLFRSYTC